MLTSHTEHKSIEILKVAQYHKSTFHNSKTHKFMYRKCVIGSRS